ncbi:MAG: 2-dehydro-3-deoxy-D-gluconate 5-dehydrogenase KduD [bacterium]|nr:2-dehydro-3-deoxy-D-gluconate 5-dehydrogenase KduD [bacterium]
MGLDLFALNGKVAVVTGASRGLGKAMAFALGEAGADVAIIDLLDGIHDTAKEIEILGRKILPIQADLANISDLQGIVDRVMQHFGRIDILVNNAGIIRRANVLEFSEKDWDDVITLNLKSVFFLSQLVAREMLRQHSGKIINIASLLSFSGGLRVPSYTASKAGVAQITKALANEWAASGINVNAIAPGYMVTDNTASLRQDEVRYKQITDRIPCGRWGLPDDLKGAVVFLASAASDYIHGHILVVDGGWMAR